MTEEGRGNDGSCLAGSCLRRNDEEERGNDGSCLRLLVIPAQAGTTEEGAGMAVWGALLGRAVGVGLELGDAALQGFEALLEAGGLEALLDVGGLQLGGDGGE